ncbi:MAG: hypothetical protein R3F62_26545 [Planctomycetota bacterium]
MKRALPWLVLTLSFCFLPYAGTYLYLRRHGFLVHKLDYYGRVAHFLEARPDDPAWLVGLYAPLELVEVAWWSTRTPGEGQTLFAFACGIAASVLWRRRTETWQGRLAVCTAISALCVFPADVLVRFAITPSTGNGWAPLPRQLALPQDAAAVISLVGLAFLVLVGVRFWEPAAPVEEEAASAPRVLPRAEPGQPTIVFPARRAA